MSTNCDAWLNAWRFMPNGRVYCTRLHGHSGGLHWHELTMTIDPLFGKLKYDRLVFTDDQIIEGARLVMADDGLFDVRTPTGGPR